MINIISFFYIRLCDACFCHNVYITFFLNKILRKIKYRNIYNYFGDYIALTNWNLTSINIRQRKTKLNQKTWQKQRLFFRARTQYELTLVASDSLNENYTKIIINVRDVNDLPPVFPEKLYCKVMDEEIAAPFPMLQVHHSAIQTKFIKQKQNFSSSTLFSCSF